MSFPDREELALLIRVLSNYLIFKASRMHYLNQLENTKGFALSVFKTHQVSFRASSSFHHQLGAICSALGRLSSQPVSWHASRARSNADSHWHPEFTLLSARLSEQRLTTARACQRLHARGRIRCRNDANVRRMRPLCGLRSLPSLPCCANVAQMYSSA
jgi:hypothetical protein